MKLTLIILFALMFCVAGNATTYYVNDNSTFADTYTTAIGNNANPGTTASPFADLTFAMTVVVSGDSILVDAGNYTDTDVIIPVSISDLTIQGASMSTTIFDGSASTGIFVFMEIHGTDIKVTDLTAQHYDSGGAIDIFGSSASDSTRVNFTDCYFFQNETYTSFDTNPHGGAFYIGVSGANEPAVVEIIDCQLADNLAEQSNGGGAVYIEDDSRLYMEGCRLTCNNSRAILTTYEGGAILFNNGFGTLRDCFISGSPVQNQQGGGLMAKNASTRYTVNIIQCIFTDNTGRQGAAIYAEDNYDINIINSLIYDNHVTGGFGNGGSISGAPGVNITIWNSTIADNTSSHGTDGGGLASDATTSFNVFNSIIWNNQVSNVRSAAVFAEYSDIEPVNDAHSGTTGNITTDPLFVGGGDYTLQGTSLAINAGILAGAPTDDLTGVTRVGNPDMGAFESGSTYPVTDLTCAAFITCTPPTGLVLTATPNPICEGDSSVISIASSQVGVFYQLRDDANDTLIGNAINGTGGTITFSTGPLTTTMTYNILASQLDLPTCQTELGPITITVHSAPSVDAGTSTNLCNGDTLNIGGSPTASGGFGGYVYSWTPIADVNDPTISNPNAYPTADTWFYVTVTSGACSTTDSMEITVSPVPVADAGPATAIFCDGDSLVIGGSPTGSGGTGALTYSWDPNTDIDDNSLENPNVWPSTNTTYILTVSDVNLCSSVDSVQITVNPTPTADAGSPTATICDGDTIAIGGAPSGAGGTGVLTYSWNPNTDIDDNSLANPNVWPSSNTTYVLTVSDVNLCSTVDSIQITVNPTPTADAGSTTSTICDGDSIIIGGTPSGAGGTGALTYSWDPNTDIDDNSLENPNVWPSTNTTYILTVSDVNLCSSVDSVQIAVNPTPTADAGSPTATICDGDTLAIGGAPSGVGGTGSLTYSWNPNTDIDDNSLANPNVWPSSNTTYVLTVSDVNLCSSVDSVQITVNPTPTADAGLSSEIICDGDTLAIGGSPSGSGGTGALTYSWNPNTDIDDNSLANPVVWPNSSTTYVLTVSDVNLCTASDSIQITVNPTPVASATASFTTICDGDTTLLDASTSSGGTGVLSFLWSPAADLDNAASSTPNAWPSATTEFIVTVTDQNSCSHMDSVSVTVNALPTADISGMIITDANCGLSNGSITGITASGAPVLTFDWNDGSGSVGSALDLNPVPSGTYTLTITDGNMCSAQYGPYGLNDIGGPTLDISGLVSTPDTCGQGVGSITGVVVTGGVGVLTYDWNDGTSSVGSALDLNGVGAGTYTLLVTDGAGCSSATGPFTITDVPAPSLDISGLVNAADTCGLTVGSITGITLIGGTGPFNYTWDDGTSTVGTSADLTNVGPGSYNITITDNAGCSVVGGPFNILDVPGPTLDLAGILVTDANCGQADGSITGAVVTGGTGVISYTWNDGAGTVGTSSDLLNIPTGTYTLTITDNAGCSSVGAAVNILDTPGPTINDGSIVIAQASCGGSDGSISGITVSGGTTPYAYDWDNGTGSVGTTLDLLTQPSGNYTFMVTDSNGCVASSGPYIITEAGAPVIDISGLTSGAETCDSINGSISGLTISGGTAPFSFSWSDGTSVVDTLIDVTNLQAGNYTVTVTDNNGCSAIYGPVTIDDLTGPSLDLNGLVITDASCGLDNGSISGILATGGNGTLSYLWTNADTTMNISGLAANGYTLTVTDSLGCLDSASAVVGTITPGNVLGVDDFASTEPVTLVNIDAGVNDTGDASTINIIAGPTNGTAVNNGDGSIDYTPNVGFQGTDQITYTICDAVCTNLCDTAVIYIDVSEVVPIDIPNGFSPNGDGINDYFVIVGLEQYPDNDIIIFNRWGDEVFMAAPYQNDWDGSTTNGTLKISGDKVTDGTYFFILNLGVDGIDPINGFIELRRQ